MVLELLGPSTGGMRQHVAQLVRSLPAAGWRARVAAPPGVGAGASLGAVAEVPVPSGPSPLGLLRARAALAPLTEGVELIHAHGLKAGWAAALSGTGVPVVVTVHNLVLDEGAERWRGMLRRLEGWLPARVDGVIAVSEGIADRFGGPSASLWMVAPAGPPPIPSRPSAEVRRSLGVAPGAPLVVSVARLHPQKDLPTLIDVAALLRASVPDVRVVVVGEGPLEHTLQTSIDARGLHDTVVLAGPRANAADELAAADAVLVTSLWESGPLVASEALMLGRPLISTPVGFVPRLVTDGESGRLAPVGDAAALAAAVEDVLRDPSGSAAMAAVGQRRAEELLGPDRLVAEVASVYDAVLSRRGGSR